MGRRRTSRRKKGGLTLVHNSPRMPMMPEMDLDRTMIPIRMSPESPMNPMMMGSPLPHGLVSPVVLSDIKSPRPLKTIVVPVKSAIKSARRSSGKKRGKKPVKPKGKKPSSRPIRRAVNNVVKKVTPKKNKPKRSSRRGSSKKSMDEAMKRLSAPKRSSRKSSSKMSASKKRKLQNNFMREQADIENML